MICTITLHLNASNRSKSCSFLVSIRRKFFERMKNFQTLINLISKMTKICFCVNFLSLRRVVLEFVYERNFPFSVIINVKTIRSLKFASCEKLLFRFILCMHSNTFSTKSPLDVIKKLVIFHVTLGINHNLRS